MAVVPSDLSHFDAVADTSDSKAPYPTVAGAVFCIFSLSSLPADEQGISENIRIVSFWEPPEFPLCCHCSRQPLLDLRGPCILSLPPPES